MAMFPSRRVHHFASVVSGGTPKNDDSLWDGDIPFITPPDLNGLDGESVESTRRTLTEKGVTSGSSLVESGVIFSCRAPVGHVGRVVEPSAFNQGCKVLVSNGNDRFLAYALVAHRSRLSALANGTTFMEVSSSAIANMELPLPDLDTQRRIADYLDKETAQIDALVAELDEYVELLEKRKQLVIDHYAAPRDVPRAAIGIDAKLVTSGSRGWGQYYADSGERFLRITDIQRNSIEISDKSVQYVHLPANSEGTRTLTKVGDILVSITADLGSVGLVNTEHVGCYTSQHVALVRLIGNKFHSDFAAWALKTSEVQRFFTQEGSGGTKQGLTLDEIKQARIPLPPLDKQEEIAQIITEEFAQTDSIITQCRELKELLLKRRQVLITDVVTGKVEV